MKRNQKIKTGDLVRIVSEKNYYTRVASDIGKLGSVVDVMPVDGPILVALEDGREVVSQNKHLELVK